MVPQQLYVIFKEKPVDVKDGALTKLEATLSFAGRSLHILASRNCRQILLFPLATHLEGGCFPQQATERHFLGKRDVLRGLHRYSLDQQQMDVWGCCRRNYM